MTAQDALTESRVERKAPPGKFRVFYTDPRGSEEVFDRDCNSLNAVRSYFAGMLAAQRASMSVFDEWGERLTRLS